jgi:hypothetical protein
MGEAPASMVLVEDVADVAELPFPPDAKLALLTQTTLSVDEARVVIDAIRKKYPQVVGPNKDDICYATQNRQEAVRTLVPEADVVLVLGVAGLPGAHAQLRVLRDVLALGVPAERVVPVVNRAPRSPRSRAELSRALVQLLRPASSAAALGSSPLFVPERRRLDDLVRDGGRLPAAVVQPVASAVRALLDRVRAPAGDHRPTSAEPAAVTPGSLATWAGSEVAGEASR